ncbi:MAG: hypothetical protein Q7U03_11645 [Syntrophales bacterium]|nr:hypothetical protein [Syntrophales bacterium]
MPSIEKLNLLAANVLILIDRLLLDQSIVESILEIYTGFCSSDEARRLNIPQVHVSDEMRVRLRFECTGFCTFLVTLRSSKYFTEKGWLLRHQNQKLNQMFHGALATAFIEHCNNSGMNALREIQLVAVHPKPEFGFGDCLDPLDCLEEYRSAFMKENGGDLVRFGKRIGMALDAAHYPLLEIIGGNLGKQMLLVSDYALAKAFSPSEGQS